MTSAAGHRREGGELISEQLTNYEAIVTYAALALAVGTGILSYVYTRRRAKEGRGDQGKAEQAKAEQAKAAAPPVGSDDEEKHDIRYYLTVIGALALIGVGTGFTIFAEKSFMIWERGAWTFAFALFAFVAIRAVTSKDGLLTNRVHNIRHSVSNVETNVGTISTRSDEIRDQVDEVDKSVDEIEKQVRRAQTSISKGADSIERVLTSLQMAEKGLMWRANKARMIEQFSALLPPGVGQIPTTYRFTVWGQKTNEFGTLIPLYLPVLDERTSTLGRPS